MTEDERLPLSVGRIKVMLSNPSFYSEQERIETMMRAILDIEFQIRRIEKKVGL